MCILFVTIHCAVILAVIFTTIIKILTLNICIWFKHMKQKWYCDVRLCRCNFSIRCGNAISDVSCGIEAVLSHCMFIILSCVPVVFQTSNLVEMMNVDQLLCQSLRYVTNLQHLTTPENIH